MLYGWMRSVIFYLLLAGLALHMAPTSGYRKYVRYFIGLVVLVLLAKPVSYLFHLGSGDLQELLAKMEEGPLQGDVPLAGGSMYDYYDISLRETMKQELAPYGVTDVTIISEVTGNVLACTIFIDHKYAQDSMQPDIANTQNGEDADASLKKYISDVYNVEYARIYVVRR